jgi:hypothetical protein
MSSTTRDRWVERLAERRFGGDSELRAATLAQLVRGDVPGFAERDLLRFAEGEPRTVPARLSGVRR